MKTFLSLFVLVLSVRILNSLWILKNDEWMDYLPIVLILMSLYLVNDSHKKRSDY